MGLFDFLSGNSGNQAQVPGSTQPPQMNPLQRLLQPEIALPMAAALLGNQGNAQNFGNALGAAGQGLQQQKLKAQTNRTGEWLRKQDQRYADMLDNGFEPGDVYKLYTQERQAQKADPYKVVGGQVFNTQDQSWIAPPGGGEAETGLVPQMMRNPTTGETIFVQPTKDGRLLPSQVPPGFVPYDPYQKSYETGAGSAAGKARGEAEASYRSMSSKMPGLEAVVVKLDDLANKATYTLAGRGLDEGMRQAGMEPREAAVARADYIATVDNQILPLLRDTFGAAFTVKEGETLRATLGDPNKTPTEKQVVLRAFIEQKRRDVEALATQSGLGGGAAPQPAPAPGGGGYTIIGVE